MAFSKQSKVKQMTAELDAFQPNTAELDAFQPNTAELDAFQPNTAELDAFQPKIPTMDTSPLQSINFQPIIPTVDTSPLQSANFQPKTPTMDTSPLQSINFQPKVPSFNSQNNNFDVKAIQQNYNHWADTTTINDFMGNQIGSLRGKPLPLFDGNSNSRISDIGAQYSHMTGVTTFTNTVGSCPWGGSFIGTMKGRIPLNL